MEVLLLMNVYRKSTKAFSNEPLEPLSFQVFWTFMQRWYFLNLACIVFCRLLLLKLNKFVNMGG